MRTRYAVAPQAIALVFALGLAVTNLSGQASITATQVRGTVHDASGALVPRAQVAATNQATGVVDRTTTDSAGRYIFVTLQPAVYTFSVEAQGFKKAVRPGVELRVGQQVDLDLALEVGQLSDSVEITGEAPLLNSVSAALGQAVDNHYMTEMPLPDRQIMGLAYLAPGVTEVSNGAPYGTTGLQFSSNGQRYSSAEVRLDGALITSPEGGEGALNQINFQPPPEIIQEFAVQNNSFSAEYGNNGGTVINLIMKSGSNQIHGTGYYFEHRPFMDANNFFANKAGQPKSEFGRDQFGGVVGGPIRKNKTFFFFSYDKIKFNSLAAITNTVPTDAERSGDFSKALNPDGSLRTIFDPYTVNGATTADPSRAPFSGNIIPGTRINPIAQNLMKYFPTPTSPGDPVTGFNNFFKSGSASSPTWRYDVKLDHNFSDKSQITGRFTQAKIGGGSPQYYTATNPYDYTAINNTTTNASIQYTHTLTPTTVISTQVAVERASIGGHAKTFDMQAAGFPANIGTGRYIFPFLSFDNSYSGGSNWYTAGIQTAGDALSAHTLPHWNLSLSKFMGGHSLKAGYEQRIILTNYCQPCGNYADLGFSSPTTAQSVFNPDSNQGQPIASFLLGWNDGSLGDRTGAGDQVADKSMETAFYVQDDWKVTSRLTVNAGVRYEWSTPYTERHNRVQFANFSGDSGVNVPGLGEIKGYTEIGSASHRGMSPDWNNIAPRVGVAYRINDKTVFRAGAGVYYGINPATNYWLYGPAFETTTPITNSRDGGLTQYASLSNPAPNGLVQPQGDKYGKKAMWGYGAGDLQQIGSIQNAEIYQWNAGFQRQVKGGILFELAYSGNRGVHLPNSYANNQNSISVADRLKYAAPGALSQQVPNPFYSMFVGPNAVFNEPASAYDSPTLPINNLLQPYPQYDGGFTGINAGRPVGNSSYHALQIKFEKRYANGLNFLGSYTFSKMLDDSTGSDVWLVQGAGGWGAQDPHNLRLEKSVSGGNTPNRLVFSWGYELPVGRGKQFGKNMPKALDLVVGGWQLNGFGTYQSGLPLLIGMTNGHLSGGSQRPDWIGSIFGSSIKDTVNGKGIRFDPAGLARPALQVPGTMTRYEGEVRSDSIKNIDLSLFKNISFREHMRLQLRAEAFNSMNRTRFADPNTTWGDPAFGTITGQANNPRTIQLGARFQF